MICKIAGYVPNDLILDPDDCGDYIRLRINSDGMIENWPENPDYSDFIEGSESVKRIDTDIEEEKSSNNYLSELTIDIKNFIFDKNTTEYALEVDNDIQIITISAKAEDKKAQVTGAGQKALKVGENKYTITVITEDETKREYNIVITREKIVEEEVVEIIEEPKTNSTIIYVVIGFISCLIIILIRKILKNK